MNDPINICKRYFGFDSFHPIQAEVVNHVLCARHALLEYVKTKEDRKAFIHRYFGLDNT